MVILRNKNHLYFFKQMFSVNSPVVFNYLSHYKGFDGQ
jgi:hypothetical protein